METFFLEISILKENIHKRAFNNYVDKMKGGRGKNGKFCQRK